MCPLKGRRHASSVLPSRRAFLLAPAAFTLAPKSVPAGVSRTHVSSVADFAAALDFLAHRHRYVAVYISARWCPICAELDATVLNAAGVTTALRQIPLLEVDVTITGLRTRALLNLLAAEGPPALFLADAPARTEVAGTRLVGRFSEKDLLQRMRPLVDGIPD